MTLPFALAVWVREKERGEGGEINRKKGGQGTRERY